jgi:HSP20 family protein
MNRVFETVFGQHFGQAGRMRAGYVYPAMNVTETEADYVVQCEVPGLDMADLEVYVAGDQLTISGSRPETIPDGDVTLHRHERDAGRFSRAITLPGPVDSAKTQATLAEGVLTVRIAKTEEVKPRQIAVRAE